MKDNHIILLFAGLQLEIALNYTNAIGNKSVFDDVSKVYLYTITDSDSKDVVNTP